LFTLNAKRLDRLVRPDLLTWMCFYRWRADDAEVFIWSFHFSRNQVQPWQLDRGENSRVFSFSFKQQWWTQSNLGVWTLGFKSIFRYGNMEGLNWTFVDPLLALGFGIFKPMSST
jgi:hypothetical protein